MDEKDTDKENNYNLPFEAPDSSKAPSSSASTIDELLDWRVRDRIRTLAAGLVLCLHLGVDPPDVTRPSPCARWESWIDPVGGRAVQTIGIPESSGNGNSDLEEHMTLHLKSSTQPTTTNTNINNNNTNNNNLDKIRDSIARSLLKNYEQWQPRVRYKPLLDPTIDDLRKLCISLRKSARSERVLFHYNGHGVPRPTRNGELWVFNKQFTQYIPVNVTDVLVWLGTPSVWVFDCPGAAFLSNVLRKSALSTVPFPDNESTISTITLESLESPIINTSSQPLPLIIFSACESHETLPLSPDLPADILTSCLTTPLDMALRWHCHLGGPLLPNSLSIQVALKIPGKISDRRTPLGELNWIFTAITDTIAWIVLPRDLFRKLYRQDLLIASLSRNYLLAQRILKSLYCTASAHPVLPSTHQHTLWTLWDHTLDTLLAQITQATTSETIQIHQSTFFPDQLDAFELWLKHHRSLPPAEISGPPDQLPAALQVLLSQNLRPRALRLFAQFCDFGPWACLECLHVGIHPYILKLLQSTSSVNNTNTNTNNNTNNTADTSTVTSSILHIWTRLMSVDSSCKLDLLKDSSFLYFVNSMATGPVASAAALVAFCLDNPEGRDKLFENESGNELIIKNSNFNLALLKSENEEILWRLLLHAQFSDKLCNSNLYTFFDSDDPKVRAATIYAINMNFNEPSVEIKNIIPRFLVDPSPLVRLELLNAVCKTFLKDTTSQDDGDNFFTEVINALTADPFEPISSRALKAKADKSTTNNTSHFAAHCLINDLNFSPVEEFQITKESEIIESSGLKRKYRVKNQFEIDLWLERPQSARKFDAQVAVLESDKPIKRIIFHPFKSEIYALNSLNYLNCWDWEEESDVDFERLNRIQLAKHSQTITSISVVSDISRSPYQLLLLSCTADGTIRLDDPESIRHSPSSHTPQTAFSCGDTNVLGIDSQPLSGGFYLAGDTKVSFYNLSTQKLTTLPRLSQSKKQRLTALLKHENDLVICGDCEGNLEMYNFRTMSSFQIHSASSHSPSHEILHLWKHSADSFYSAASNGTLQSWTIKQHPTRSGDYQCESHNKYHFGNTTTISNSNTTSSSYNTTTNDSSCATIVSSSSSCLSSHPQLPKIFVYAAPDQSIKLTELLEDHSMKNLQSIRYHDGFLGHRLGQINSLIFHPSRMVLGAVTSNTFISIYSLKRESYL